jgi:pimeloyl-ACP methyl ester carboxylesterase
MVSWVSCVIVAGMTTRDPGEQHMSTRRTHYVTTTDGATIGGTVHGHGPPLVFLQGSVGDGDLDWQALLPHLTGRFTCYLPSYRGRGLSSDHSDLSFGRLVDDVLAYVDSIEAPTGLVGWSAGAGLALAAAGAQSDAVEAVAPFEPLMPRVMDEQEQATLRDTLARVGGLAAEGELPAAVRAFLAAPFHDEEIAAAEDAGFVEAAGRYIPSLLDLLQQWMSSDDPGADDPTMLGSISVPVLMLYGSDTQPILTASAHYVAAHVPNATVHEIPGVGHAAPLTHPEAIADALTRFFSPAQQPA